jgi:hypothetical protein
MGDQVGRILPGALGGKEAATHRLGHLRIHRKLLGLLQNVEEYGLMFR